MEMAGFPYVTCGPSCELISLEECTYLTYLFSGLISLCFYLPAHLPYLTPKVHVSYLTQCGLLLPSLLVTWSKLWFVSTVSSLYLDLPHRHVELNILALHMYSDIWMPRSGTLGKVRHSSRVSRKPQSTKHFPLVAVLSRRPPVLTPRQTSRFSLAISKHGHCLLTSHIHPRTIPHLSSPSDFSSSSALLPLPPPLPLPLHLHAPSLSSTLPVHKHVA